MTTKDYKNILNSFNTADFGGYDPEIFVKGNKYRKPTVYPSGGHPSILFTKNSIGAVRENLNAEEAKRACEIYTEISEKEWDGRFVEINKQGHNFESSLAAIIEAKAFRYAMTGEEKYGYEAIIAAKNAVLTLNVPRTVGDACRRHGYLMYVVACAYDWCYDLMSEEDKRQIISGCAVLLGTEFEMCRYTFDGNILPDNQCTAYGHGAEDQLLVDYLSFAIACYTEAPEIYEFVGGRVLNDFVESQNFLMQSGSHWEGSMYGPVRTCATIVSNLLINKMTDGAVTPFKNVEKVVETFTHNMRPDGQPFRIGDMNENKVLSDFQFVWFANCCTYTGNLYKNPYLKSFGYKYTKEFTKFDNMVAGMSAVQFLATNEPSVPHIYEEKVPLTHKTSYPFTNIFARSAYGDKDAFGVYMTMPESFTSSHAHMECGSFQLFYKGALASDSGAYTSWYGPHHMGYNMSTISSNSILVFNPAMKDYIHPKRVNMIYSGGQSIDNGAILPDGLEAILSHKSLGQCTSLGAKNGEENGKYLYSYMAGDMTRAYDAVTVDEVCRYMLAIPTDNKECPFAFMTFDRITAKDASFKKTALIHVQEEPEITKDGFAIVKNTKGDYHGKMVVQSAAFDTEYEVVGGEGREFWVVDHNIPTERTLVNGSIAEYGWGRIEISPKNPEKTNRMLTVMYVTDAENENAPVRARDISTDVLIGAEIFGNSVFFPKTEKLLSEKFEISLEKCGKCFITGASAGEWTITKDGAPYTTVTVKEGENLIVLDVQNGKYAFSH